MGTLVVKLGGSLITDKERPESLREELLGRLCEELAQLHEESGPNLLLSHGSGSFGHVAASRHRLQTGLRSEAQLFGVSETQSSAHRLHQRVLAELRARGLAAFSLAPASFLVAADGVPVAVHAEPVLRALALGLLPVVFGDVVLDRRRGVSICSTETVVSALVEPLRVDGRPIEKALWLGTTSGVLDRQGQPVPRVDESNFRQVLEAAGDARGSDVTGGMRHRVEQALELAHRGVRSCILNGLEPGQLLAAARDQAVDGTWIEAMVRNREDG